MRVYVEISDLIEVCTMMHLHMATLCPDILLHYLHIADISITELSVIRQLSSTFSRQAPLSLTRLSLPFAVPISSLLTLFPHNLPILSGAVYVDLSCDEVPWAKIRYQHLALYFEGDRSKESLMPLYTQALQDYSKSLSLHCNASVIVEEIVEGYVSKGLVSILQSMREIITPSDTLIEINSRHVWIRGRWDDSLYVYLQATTYGRIESIRSDCRYYLNLGTLMKMSCLKELGPMVIVMVDSYDEVDGAFTHPHLLHLNIIACKDTLKWALKQDLTFTLYAPRAMLSLLRRRYAYMSKIVGYQALD